MLGLLLRNQPFIKSRAFIHLSQEYPQPKALEKLKLQYALLKNTQVDFGPQQAAKKQAEGLESQPFPLLLGKPGTSISY